MPCALSSARSASVMSSLYFLPPSRKVFIVLIIAKRMTAVKRKLTIAMMKSPQSIYTDLLRSISAEPNATCMPSAFLGTSIVMSPERSPIGIAFISGLNIPLTSAVTIAVNAAPMIIPTARSITFPRVINVLNSLNSFFILCLSSIVYYIYDTRRDRPCQVFSRRFSIPVAPPLSSPLLPPSAVSAAATVAVTPSASGTESAASR